jgi:phosphonoacetaldehyde dehydrogenase
MSMTLSTAPSDVATRAWPLFLAGKPIDTGAFVDVRNPYTGHVVGRVCSGTAAHVDQAVAIACGYSCSLTRFERSAILERARTALEADSERFARIITGEAGLCIRETRYEVSRALDVLKFAAIEALHDDGESFACDVSSVGKARRAFTMREPVSCVAAITPFNHPLNTVIHKLAPAIAVGAPVILKPSEKTPMSALALAELLFASGLPGPMLSVLLGPTDQIATPLVKHPRVNCLTFTGSTAVGVKIAESAGYKRLALELGGNSELIVLSDADLDLAAHLACEGAFRNSGQRCTAAKRLLVDESIADDFVQRLVTLARGYRAGDPTDPDTRVGTVIDKPAAERLEDMINQAVRDGARLLLGGARRGALLEPAVLDHVPRTSTIVREEAFGPIAKVLRVKNLDDAIALANDTPYGLSTGVVTQRLDWAMRVVREVKTGNVNINELPGYRTERTPFGGVKMSGLGVKEGVAEACKWMTTVKTFSMPW